MKTKRRHDPQQSIIQLIIWTMCGLLVLFSVSLCYQLLIVKGDGQQLEKIVTFFVVSLLGLLGRTSATKPDMPSLVDGGPVVVEETK